MMCKCGRLVDTNFQTISVDFDKVTMWVCRDCYDNNTHGPKLDEKTHKTEGRANGTVVVVE